MNFFVNFHIVTSSISEEKKRMVILGQIAGLKAQLAFVQSGHTVYESSLVATLRSNTGRPLLAIFRDHRDWELNLNEGMFPDWKECSTSADSNIYFANIGAAGIAVSTIYRDLVNNSKLNNKKILIAVEEIVEFYVDFLVSQLDV